METTKKRVTPFSRGFEKVLTYIETFVKTVTEDQQKAWEFFHVADLTEAEKTLLLFQSSH